MLTNAAFQGKRSPKSTTAEVVSDARPTSTASCKPSPSSPPYPALILTLTLLATGDVIQPLHQPFSRCRKRKPP